MSEPTRSLSLRKRLAAGAAVGAALITAAAGLVVITALWNSDGESVTTTAELLAFETADSAGTGNDAIPTPDIGADQFALAVQGGEVVAATGEVPIYVIDNAEEEAAFADPSGESVVVSELDSAGGTWTTASTSCSDIDACDAVIVGVRAPSWLDSFASRAVWFVIAVAGISALAGVGAAFLVTRALRPVEAMRAALEETSAEDLSGRVPVVETGDELQDLALTLNATLGRLEHAVEANQRFVADAAHELRSPLTGVRAAIELRARGETPDELLPQALHEIDRASALVDDLLLLAKSRETGPTSGSADLADLTTYEVNAAERRHPEISVNTSISTTATAGMEPRVAARIIRNLLDNAAAYGAGSLSVVLIGENRSTLSVSDDGPGIPVADRALVFDRFVRLDESRERGTGGTGLGLAIVKELLEARGGSVRIEAGALGGAEFIVTFPAAST